MPPKLHTFLVSSCVFYIPFASHGPLLTSKSPRVSRQRAFNYPPRKRDITINKRLAEPTPHKSSGRACGGSSSQPSAVSAVSVVFGKVMVGNRCEGAKIVAPHDDQEFDWRLRQSHAQPKPPPAAVWSVGWLTLFLRLWFNFARFHTFACRVVYCFADRDALCSCFFSVNHSAFIALLLKLECKFTIWALKS